jgi:hypothetical protein
LGITHRLDDFSFRVADSDAPPVDALDKRAAPDGYERRVLGESGGEVLRLQPYPLLRATIRRSTKSWATRILAIAAGKSPPA